jgi:hypothetical protein
LDKIRQAAVGMPAVILRMPETCARLASHLTTGKQRQALMDQAEAL